MRRKLLIVLILLAVFFIGGFTFAQKSQPQYEYKFEYNVSEKKANQLGAEGWELVTASATGSGPASNVETFVFKRAK